MDNKGHGLKSLLSDSDLVLKHKVASFRGVKEVKIEQIQVGKQQPRSHFEKSTLDELAESIRVHGIIQPITVREVSQGKFEIISGERRYRATQLAGLESIPAFIRDVDDSRSLEMALIENIQRENLNPIEIALSFQRMVVECDLKQEDLGQRVGKSRSTVANFLRLLNLPTEIQSGLILGVISMGQAKPLIPISDEGQQLDLYNKILEQELSSREIEALVKKGNAFEAQASELDIYKEDMRIEEITLKGKTIVPLKIQVQDVNKGNLTIRFSGEEQLKEILQKISQLN